MDDHTKPRGARLGLLLLTIVVLPGALIAIGTFGLTAAGLDSHKALSMSGLIAVGVAAIWGPVIALAKLDERIAGWGRATPDED